MMKGIILAGGSGTRLYPLTKGTSKQMLPVFDKPMIYYPLSILMLAQIRDILIITTKEDQSNFQRLLGDGSNYGVNLEWVVQNEPKGLAEAFIIGEEFIGQENVCLILGDNFFYGQNLISRLNNMINNLNGATVCGVYVNDPKAYGVLELKEGKVIAIHEKPENPPSNFAVPGLYFYDNTVIKKAKNVKPSARGEIEITSINNMYIQEGRLNAQLMGRGFTWFDTGSHTDLLQAANFVETIQSRQGYYIGAIDEIGFNNGWISEADFTKACEELKKTEYGQYLNRILKESKR